MLETATLFPFSPFAFQASLQTSTLQASNRTAGAAMSPNQQSNLKGHLSNVTRSHIHLVPPATVTDSTPESGEESGNAEANTGNLSLGTQSPLVESHAASINSDSVGEVSSTLSESVQQ